VYNARVLYRSSVVEIYEDGSDVVMATAAELENYLTMAKTTLRVTADTVDLLKRNGASSEEILQYLLDQTAMQAEQFDENFTGLYAYIDGEYMDGLGWEPPEGYDPVKRDWYTTVVAGGGEVVIVSPYLDAQTGDIVITVGKSISPGNVVCLDVIVNHIQEVTERVDIAGKGFGMVVNDDGFIVAHRDRELNGQNVSDVYGPEALERITEAAEESFDVTIDGEDYTLFVHPIMEQWTDVIVIDNTELYESVHSQLAISILIFLVTFWLIAFFYYFGYKNEQANSRKVEELNMQVVTALAEAIDAKDEYTNGHSARVAKYSRMIASRAGYSESRRNEIYMMALLHDVGKIGIPDEVIRKPGKLTEEEYGLIKSHPVIGSRILGNIKERPELATGARWHHERFDGSGYPDGLAGETIPEEARIIAVADAYDAMTSRRSYRDVMTQEKVRSELEEGSGTQFDPQFAKIMIRLIDEDKAFTLRENGGQTE
ncbi:MAG: HD domain-containing protein, partial [Firmicutes bacterium]|nr:HD domain-containing protein [Bacillota bacterium]